jgi:hypothetical protein
MLFRHDLKRPGDGSFLSRQMRTEIFVELGSQHFQTQLRIAIVLAVESHPRGFTFRSYWIFEIVLNFQRINESNLILKKMRR